MVVIRPGDHVWLTAYGERKLEVAIGAQIKKSDGGRKVFNDIYMILNNVFLRLNKISCKLPSCLTICKSFLDLVNFERTFSKFSQPNVTNRSLRS